MFNCRFKFDCRFERRNIPLIFSSNSEAKASELLENIEEGVATHKHIRWEFKIVNLLEKDGCYQQRNIIYSRFSCKSAAKASELLENLEEMLSRY